MVALVTLHHRVVNRERGVTKVEYALIIALVAVVITAAVTSLGGGLSSTLDSIVTQLGGKPEK